MMNELDEAASETGPVTVNPPRALTMADVFKDKDLLNGAMIAIQLISIFDEQDLSTKFWQAAAGLLVAKIAYLRANGTLATSVIVTDEEMVPWHEKDRATLFSEGFVKAKNYVDVSTAIYCGLAAINLMLTACVSYEAFFVFSSRSTANIVLSMIEVSTAAMIQVISNIIYFNIAVLMLVLSPLFFNMRSPEHTEITACQACVSGKFWLVERLLPLFQGGLMLAAYGAVHESIMAGERPGVFTTHENPELITKFDEIVATQIWRIVLSITNFKPGIDFAHAIEPTQADLQPTNIPSGHTMLVLMATFTYIALASIYFAPEFTAQHLRFVLSMATLPGLFEGFCRSFGLSHSFSGVLEALCYGYLALVIGYMDKQSIMNAKQWLSKFLPEVRNFITEALRHPDLSLTNAAGFVAGLVTAPVMMPVEAAKAGISSLTDKACTFYRGEDVNGLRQPLVTGDFNELDP